jgi:hypothetical protein
VFDSLLGDDEMRFMAVLHDLGMNRPPREVEIRKTVPEANRLDGNLFVMNLYDPVTSDTLNSLEHRVASGSVACCTHVRTNRETLCYIL